MTLDFYNFYKYRNKIIKGDVIDLSEVEIIHPWSLVAICLLLIERISKKDKKLILPINIGAKTFLKRMNLEKILLELGYEEEKSELETFQIDSKEDLNTQRLLHCYYADEFSATLAHFISMFENFGLSLEDSQRATSLVGELGNNVFDHNLGNWPTRVAGCIIAGQHYPVSKTIEIAVGDPGVGFFNSLKVAFPNVKTDLEAIKLGLEGNTGRVGELRGNGLKLIQQWTIENFYGKVVVHSGNGLIMVDKNGMKEYTVNRILGTIAQFVIQYK